jgi:hypothetical protein
VQLRFPQDITHYVVIDGKLKEALAGGNPLIRWAPAPGSAPNVPCEALSRVIVVFRNGYVHGPDIAGKIRWWHFEAGKDAEDIIFYCVVKTDYSAAAEITMGDGLKTSITVGERTIHIKATDEKCPTISSCVHSYENNDDGIRQALKWLLEG